MKHNFFYSAIVGVACLIQFSGFKHAAFSYVVMSCSTGYDGQLEEATASLQKAKGKQATYPTYTIEGTRSAKRIPINQTCFQVLSGPGQSDPFQYVSLYKLTAGKTNRTLTLNNDGSPNSTWIPVQMPLDGDKYKVYLSKNLDKGEYAFIDKSTTAADGSMKIWEFGID
jgi:hypothetical protein